MNSLLKKAKEDKTFRQKLIQKLSSKILQFTTRFSVKITRWVPPDPGYDWEPAQVEGYLICSDFDWNMKFVAFYEYHNSWDPFQSLRMDFGDKWVEVKKGNPIHSVMVFVHNSGGFTEPE